jgi:hypothetical protein
VDEFGLATFIVDTGAPWFDGDTGNTPSALALQIPADIPIEPGPIFLITGPGGTAADQEGICEITSEGALLLASGDQPGSYQVQLEQAKSTLTGLVRVQGKGYGDPDDPPAQMVVIPDTGQLSDTVHVYTAATALAFVVDAAGGIRAPQLPTADPHVAGALWVDAAADHAVKRSAG